MFRTADDSYSIEFFSIPSFWDLQNKCSLLPLLSFSFFYFFSQTSTESSVETE